MKKFLVAMGVAAFAFVGCDDSSSASAGPNDEPGIESSSSVEQGESSSSDKVAEPAEDMSSSSDGWSWDVPKELRLNPEIEYDSITDSRDGKVYKIVKIGNQVWMAENLNYDPGQGGSNGYKYNWSWCYNNDKKNCDVGGRLYTWAAAIDSVKLAKDADNPLECGDRKYCESLPARIRGVCVEGWHLPSRDEWNELIMAVVDTANAGRIFKSQTGWIDGGNGTDSLGFSVLPVGYYHDKGKYYGDGGISRMWSSQSVSDLFATEMRIESNRNSVVLNFASGYKSFALSVRCLKD